MKSFTVYLTSLFCLLLTSVFAQDSFEGKAKAIATKIENITKEEKDALKEDIEDINKQLENGAITADQAAAQKEQKAEQRAKNIETRVADARRELDELVQAKVDGKIDNDSVHKYGIMFSHKKNKDKAKVESERRTTTQGVLAFGLNNVVTDGAVANSDFYYLRSNFFEWGLTWNTRILPESNILHVKYGFSFVYNTLHATENRMFVDTGEQTQLLTSPVGLRNKDSYFKNVFFTIPVHLELDFSKTEVKDGKKIFRSHNGVRVGLGGFAGYNTNSKQFLSYRVDGYRINQRQKGNWNVDDFNYGLSAYVGYKQTSLYVKYDLNPIFSNNAVDQHNVSAGIRFDFN